MQWAQVSLDPLTNIGLPRFTDRESVIWNDPRVHLRVMSLQGHSLKYGTWQLP